MTDQVAVLGEPALGSGEPELPTGLLSGTAAVLSRGLWRLPHLQTYLGASQLLWSPRGNQVRDVDYVVGWGHKRTAEAARAFAAERSLPFIRVEDGFLRSITPGSTQPPASLVVDHLGIYYDASSPSRLERLIARGTDDHRLIERARDARERLVRGRISKYNHAPTAPPAVLAQLPERYVLLIDQVSDDASVELGMGGASRMNEMLQIALEENPDTPVVVKAHPAAGKRGALAVEAAHSGRVIWVSDAINPHTLIERASVVYVGTSQVGFEALLHQKRVVCFGAPFYAGWGLTEDRTSIARRGQQRQLDELVAAALIQYPRYVHPVTGKGCSLEDTLDFFELQKATFERNAGVTYCFGFWWWKRPHARRFLESPEGELRFCWSAADAKRKGFAAGHRALVWGQKDSAALRAACDATGTVLERMEDGFIRSVGLGSDLTAPWSLVVDRRGIYYDPSKPSELEQILAEHEFSAAELERARALRQVMTASGLSKYNSDARRGITLPRNSAKNGATKGPDVDQGAPRVLLVPGQVESDASVQLGSPVVKTNLQLLERTRADNPSAVLLFKPHPDVLAGNRPGHVATEEALKHCDQIVVDVALADCLEVVHEVHTLTSLVGFEALLRGLEVVVHGQPFYAGWGLTVDRHPLARRKRRLTLDELVAGALLLYPRYSDPRTGYLCTAEDAVARLLEERRAHKSGGLQALPFGRQLMKTYAFVKGLAQEL